MEVSMADTYLGEVRGGVVVFEGAPPPLPEGTIVRFEPVEIGIEESMLPTLAERLKPVIGRARRLSSERAEQHGRYLHGLPE
jgi:hypothetical protein